MNMGLKGVQAIGFLTATALITGTYFLGISPILSNNSDNKSEIDQNRTIIDAQAKKLEQYNSGQDMPEVQQATVNVDNFASLIPTEQDIESSARAIASALVPGVTLSSFTFNPPQAVAPIASPGQQLEGFNALGEFSGAAPATPVEGTEEDALDEAGGSKENLAENTEAGAKPGNTAAAAGFQRIPFIIQVTADNFASLSEYMENLSSQPRLITVASVDTTGSGPISATIYAFAYMNS